METNKFAPILDTELNSVNRTTRDAMASIMKDKVFVPIYDTSLRDMKELALTRLKKVAANKVVSIRDFLKDPDNIFTMHEMVTQTK